MTKIVSAAVVGCLLWAPSVAAQERQPAAWTVLGQVVADPTTYAPAGIFYTAARLDWGSSQVFFAHGWTERNPQFTVSGRPNDRPIAYGAGNRIILGHALRDLGTSALNNAGARTVEHWLLQRYPDRRRLIRTLGWVQRIGFGAALTHARSAAHFRQWRENERLARELGYR